MYKEIIFSLAAASMLMACGGKQGQPEERIIEYVDSATGIITQRDYQEEDTVRIDGKLYSYVCALQHVDTMGVVINQEGLEYRESRVRVAVKTDSTVVFDKTYYKTDFKSFVPAEALSAFTMAGVGYNDDKRGSDSKALYFILIVGDPDEASDTFYPVELQVNPDGTSSMSKAEDIYTGSQNPGLNVDPEIEEEM